jgi:hypothetical protein
MLLREVIAIYSGIHMKQIHFSERNAEFLLVQVGGRLRTATTAL